MIPAALPLHLQLPGMNFLSQILRIVVVDLVLSGDNAVVIGLAAHSLEPRQRKQAILLGGGAACVLRIALTAIAAFLLQLRGLQAAGGLLLLWIAVKLLKQEEESHEGLKSATTMKGAIATILVADFIMSLDNVLAVAGASEGNLGLLVFGLILSMGILMFLGSLVADLVNRLWWLAYVGSGVIAWTGAAMFLVDPLVRTRISIDGLHRHVICAVITAVTLLLAHRLHRPHEET
jgi:YjbE family integral membrane protein